ncbi:MAG: hypothetical protein IJW74_06015 [Oscillospiraceae bacterium]|nr:hypothetical protein [Oscillospiraceae bacterium]
MRGYIPPQNSDENIFVKKIVRILDLAQGIGNVQFTLFMDLRQQQLFTAQANKYSDLKVKFICGYDGDGERKLAAVYPDYIEEEYINPPLVVLHTELYDSDVSHKDFLGAAMALKIDREYMGDIIVEDKQAFMICHKNVSNIIMEELCGVKKSSVSFEIWDKPLQFTKTYSEMRTATVASLRADSVVAAALNKSRTEAVKLIRQGNVKINQMDISQTDFEIFNDDVISIRYNGKYKIFCDGAKSRKDRIFINIAKY